MNLLFTLSNEKKALLDLKPAETIWYCIPYDLDSHNRIIADSYIVVTNERLLTVEKDCLSYSIPLSQCLSIQCEPQIHNGLLVITTKEQTEPAIIARCSMRHLIRLSYVARGAQMLSDGIYDKVESQEYEKHCPICGHGIPGTRKCPHCNGQKLNLLHFKELCMPYMGRFALVAVLMMLCSLCSLISPKIQQQFIDETLFNRQGDIADVMHFILLMLLITVFTIVLTIIKNWYCTSLGATMSMDIRKKLYHKVQMLSLSYIQSRKTGDLMNRIVSDSVEIRRFMEDAFGNMFSQIITMIAAAAYMAVMNWKLLVLSLIFFPIVLVLTEAFKKNIHLRFKMQRRKNDRLNSSLQDVLSGMSIVKSYGKEEEEAQKFNRLSMEYAQVQISNESFFAYFYPILSFIMGLGVYFITYFGGLDVLKGSMTPGQLLQFITYAGILYGPLNSLTRLPKQFLNMLTSLERIYDILDEEPSIVNTSSRKDFTIHGDVEFKNLTFGYKSYEPVLNNIDLKVKQGEMIGLVGPSGAGKSTMINLLMHLYEADSGELLIDGTNINDIPLDALHSQIGVVLQETFLFSGTILNNIRFSKPEASLEEVIMAAKMANAHDFICRLPDGYNTYIGSSGYRLSGGERQRLAIARALLTNPRLLILDEATSNLDTESEYLIQKALERLTKDRTTFAIAHRLSTLRNADRLVVIDNHRIAEVGTHEELIQKHGIYYGLVTAQLEMQSLNKGMKLT